MIAADGRARAPPGERAPSEGRVEVVPALATFVLLVSIIPLVIVADLQPPRAVGGVLLVFAAASLVSIAVKRASARRFKPDSEEGLSALTRGELDRAARLRSPPDIEGRPRCFDVRSIRVVRAFTSVNGLGTSS